MAVAAPPTLAFEIFAGMTLAVLCQTEQQPTDEEWDAYLRAIGPAHAIVTFRFLVVTDGGHPSRGQQKRLQAVTRDRHPRVAIVSAAASLRFVTSILGLMNPNVRCFHPAQRLEALVYLGIAADQAAAVARIVERVQERLAQRPHGRVIPSVEREGV
jgi:hypothetical protein